MDRIVFSQRSVNIKKGVGSYLPTPFDSMTFEGLRRDYSPLQKLRS